MVLELPGRVFRYYRNNPANVKRNVDSIHPPQVSTLRNTIATYNGFNLRAFRDVVRGHLRRLGYPRNDQINAAVYTTCRLYLADAGKPNYPNPQLFRWHSIEMFHRPHDRFSVITLYLIKSKFRRVGTITRRRRDDISALVNGKCTIVADIR